MDDKNKELSINNFLVLFTTLGIITLLVPIIADMVI
jgi:hypothetical protein